MGHEKRLSPMIIKNSIIAWEKIEEVWRTLLWPGRSDIIPISCMTHDGDIDINIKNTYHPIHHGIYVYNELVGVISGHQTSVDYYRCRGIYVKEDYRGFGISKILFGVVESDAVNSGCSHIWSYPRISSIIPYKKFKFVESGEVENIGYSGPNIRVIKKI